MSSAQSALEIQRTWLPLGFCAEYRLQFHPEKLYLPLLADALLHHIVGPVILSRQEISTMKGRDRLNLIDASIPTGLQPAADEFFFAAGAITHSPRSRNPQEQFCLAVESKFLPSSYSGMAHAAEIRRQQFPADVDILKLGRLIPVHLQVLRLGIDIFKPRFFSSLFGLVPTVSQTVLLEASENSCIMKINADGLAHRTELPLGLDRLFERLSTALEAVFAFNALEDYQSKLRI